jgi:hypothetical protein
MESVYNYTVYIGIDKGDYLRTVEAKILHKFPFVKSVHVGFLTGCIINHKHYNKNKDVKINIDNSFIYPFTIMFKQTRILTYTI